MYNEFARRFPMYRQSSADLVRRLQLSPGDRVLEQPEETLAWMRIPIFTARWSGLRYEQRMDSLDKAWRHFDATTIEPHRWLVRTAIKR